VVNVDGVQRYGGDFEGELTHDGNFCCDGLVFSDRSLKAGSLEAKAAYQPIRTTFADGVLTIYDRLDFTDLEEFELHYTIEADGEEVAREELWLHAAPHTAVQVEIPCEQWFCAHGLQLNVQLCKDGVVWAHTQHPLPFDMMQSEDSEPAMLVEDDCNFWFESGYTRDIVFKNNKISGCGYGFEGKGEPVVQITPQVLSKTSTKPVHGRLLLENNLFEKANNVGHLIKLEYIKEVTLKNNVFDQTYNIVSKNVGKIEEKGNEQTLR
jgi:hypothetical protein